MKELVARAERSTVLILSRGGVSEYLPTNPFQVNTYDDLKTTIWTLIDNEPRSGTRWGDCVAGMHG